MGVVNYADLVNTLQRSRGDFGDEARQEALKNRIAGLMQSNTAVHNNMMESYRQAVARRALEADAQTPATAGPSLAATEGGLNADFQSRLNQLIQASNNQIGIGSGYRSPERQAQLYNAWKAGTYKVPVVAPPGKSNHNRGLAADLKFLSAKARAFAHANAAKYGLKFPIASEAWHVEPL